MEAWLPENRPGDSSDVLMGLWRMTAPRIFVRPRSRWQRFCTWLGNKVIHLGIRIGGNDW